MNNEIRAAAERLLGSSNEWISGNSDVQSVANAYLAEHPADEDEPISEDWLRSVGFTQISGGVEGDTRLGSLRTMREYIDREGDRRWDVVDGKWEYPIPRPLKPKTRGDVRRLCAALGVTLK